MRKPRILRVGICGCAGADFYRGALDGRSVSVRRLADGPLHRPREFVLREVFVPNNGQWETVLRVRRCHFHVDLHSRGKKFQVELHGVQFLFNGAGRLPTWRVGVLQRGGWFAREWRSKRRPSARQVNATIRGLIERLDQEQLRYWLDQGRLPKGAFQLG